MVGVGIYIKRVCGVHPEGEGGTSASMYRLLGVHRRLMYRRLTHRELIGCGVCIDWGGWGVRR